MGYDDSLSVKIERNGYTCEAYAKRVFVKSKTVVNGKEREESVRVAIRGIILTHKGSGAEVKFPYTVRRQSGTFGDSRSRDLRYNARELRRELIRMTKCESAADRLLNIAMY